MDSSPVRRLLAGGGSGAIPAASPMDRLLRSEIVSRLSNLLRANWRREWAARACRRPEAGSGGAVRAARVRAQLRASHPRDGRAAAPALCAPRGNDKIRFLPERGEKPSSVHRRLWRVGRIRRTDEAGWPTGPARPRRRERQTASRAVDDLVVVAEFRDPIYPGLVSTGKVERGGDRPFHTVINAENFHALQVLLYTHEGKVDAIYVDPPYNTGARRLEVQQRLRRSDGAYRALEVAGDDGASAAELPEALLNPRGAPRLIVAIDERLKFTGSTLLLRRALRLDAEDSDGRRASHRRQGASVKRSVLPRWQSICLSWPISGVGARPCMR